MILSFRLDRPGKKTVDPGQTAPDSFAILTVFNACIILL